MGHATGAVANGHQSTTNGHVVPQTEKKVLNFGVVGIGRMGQQHALNILRLVPGAKLVAACSPAQADLDWADANLIPHGVAVYKTFEEMIEFPGLDAVVIASFTELHYQQTKTSIQKGIHVLCEKPIAQTVEQLQDLIATVKAGKAQAMVGFARRFDENYRDAVEKIRQGVIGAPTIIRSQGCEKLEDAPFMHAYVTNAAKGGGFFVDSVIHDLDLTISFLDAGEKEALPRSVCAYGTTVHFKELEDPAYRDGDNIVGVVQYSSGQISFHYNSRTAAAGYDNQTEIFGTQGKISVNLVPRQNRLELSDSTGVHTAALPSWYDRYKPCFVDEVTAFTAAVLEHRPVPISLESALRSLTIAHALQESFRTGKKIDFDAKGNRIVAA